ncbi:MAG: hypothetical protein WBL61_05900 [Bryobacteraceae bacterium]
MKRCLCLLPLAGALAFAADLAGVHSVYLLPMARGMDQYLANRLTNEHVFHVVTDPKLADAIITDHISEGFQTQLEDFSPAPKPPEAAKPANPEPTAKPDDEAEPPAKPAATGAKAKPGDASPASGLMGKAENTLSNPATASGFSRARGTVFLVDAKSRQVLWSTYDPPKDFAGKEMNRTASDIVSRLKRDLNPKK